MTQLYQHGLNRSILAHLREKFPDAQVDIKSDGYEMSKVRPLILIEPMQNNYEINVKQREAVEIIYRYQIGLFCANSVDLSIKQERLQGVFNFDTFPFYDTLQSPAIQRGYFLCDLTAVVPMPAGDISNKSEYHHVYFDVEIKDTKRRCR